MCRLVTFKCGWQTRFRCKKYMIGFK
jgi:hypothetical protein